MSLENLRESYDHWRTRPAPPGVLGYVGVQHSEQSGGSASDVGVAGSVVSAPVEWLVDLFDMPATASLPVALTRVVVTLDAEARLSAISAREGNWSFSPPRPRLFRHRDMSVALAEVIPPRRVPWARRWFWRAVPALLGSRLGRALIARRYGSGNVRSAPSETLR